MFIYGIWKRLTMTRMTPRRFCSAHTDQPIFRCSQTTINLTEVGSLSSGPNPYRHGVILGAVLEGDTAGRFSVVLDGLLEVLSGFDGDFLGLCCRRHIMN